MQPLRRAPDGDTNAENAYDYAAQDPINGYDLTGTNIPRDTTSFGAHHGAAAWGARQLNGDSPQSVLNMVLNGDVPHNDGFSSGSGIPTITVEVDGGAGLVGNIKLSLSSSGIKVSPGIGLGYEAGYNISTSGSAPNGDYVQQEACFIVCFDGITGGQSSSIDPSIGISHTREGFGENFGGSISYNFTIFRIDW